MVIGGLCRKKSAVESVQKGQTELYERLRSVQAAREHGQRNSINQSPIRYTKLMVIRPIRQIVWGVWKRLRQIFLLSRMTEIPISSA
jgi:hypothetical protein